MSEPLRVVIVDDHSIFRSGLRADLDDTIAVVGEAADVASAVSVIVESQPDVVLLDVHLPGAADDGVTREERPCCALQPRAHPRHASSR